MNTQEALQALKAEREAPNGFLQDDHVWPNNYLAPVEEAPDGRMGSTYEHHMVE